MSIERPVENNGHELDQVAAVDDGSEFQASARSTKRRSGLPFQPKPLDKQSCTESFQDRDPVIHRLARFVVVSPARRNETNVRGRSTVARDDGGKCRLEELRPDVEA